MNKNVLIVLGGGFLIAVLVALMVKASLGTNKPAPAPVAEARVSIVVAAKPLKAGDKIDETNVKWQSWPVSGVIPGAIKRDADKKDQLASAAASGRLLRPVAEGEPIVSGAIVRDRGNFLAANLREGMRAISLDLKGAALLSGFLSPGDFVDVLLTYRVDIDVDSTDNRIKNMVVANVDRFATETIMENVRVLAVDQRIADDPAQKGPRPAKSVTVEVSPEGAEVLALARRMGDVSFVLRRLGDETITTDYRLATTDSRITNAWDEVYYTMERMFGGTSQNNDIVRVYSGGTSSNVNVRQ